MSKERRLGRGLEHLLGTMVATQPTPFSPSTESPAASVDLVGHKMSRAELSPGAEHLSLYQGDVENTADDTGVILDRMMKGHPIAEISVGQIDRNPFQPRKDFDEHSLSELAESLKKHGLIQPIVLREKGDRYELVAGERRLRAAVMAGWSAVPSYLLVVDDREMAELALTENIQRKDLNAIEKATAFQRYLETYGGTQVELARRLDLDRSTVSNLMRLLELPEELQTQVMRNEISEGHARQLLRLEPSEQFEVARRIVAEGWSVRRTEERVREMVEADEAEPVSVGDLEIATRDFLPKETPPPAASEHIADLERQFRSLFGTRVKLSTNERGRGKLVIPFGSTAEFERIYQLILSRMQ